MWHCDVLDALQLFTVRLRNAQSEVVAPSCHHSTAMAEAGEP